MGQPRQPRRGRQSWHQGRCADDRASRRRRVAVGQPVHQDQRAHAVTIQKERDRLALRLLEGTRNEMIEILEVILKRFDVATLALGLAMAAQVDGLHLEARVGQGGCDHLAIPTPVLTDAVDDSHDGARRLGR